MRDSLKGKRGERKRKNMKKSCYDKWKGRVNKLIFNQWSPPIF